MNRQGRRRRRTQLPKPCSAFHHNCERTVGRERAYLVWIARVVWSRAIFTPAFLNQLATDYRTGLIDIEPSLWHQNTDIESRRPETGAEMRQMAPKI